MSNQRRGNWKPAALTDSGDRISIRTIVEFMESASNALERDGQEDASFYFQQVAEFLRDNPHKGLNEKATTVLGL
jgi:hypothetical protein